MNADNLEKLAAFLDELPERKFYFGYLISVWNNKGCGTVCCAIGWTPAVFPELVEWKECTVSWRGCEKADLADISEELFGIDDCEYRFLFEPSSFKCPLNMDATAKEVAAHIRSFIASKK